MPSTRFNIQEPKSQPEQAEAERRYWSGSSWQMGYDALDRLLEEKEIDPEIDREDVLDEVQPSQQHDPHRQRMTEPSTLGIQRLRAIQPE
ncbi:hypothetical protein [Hyalangium versicolor]|uniref:hypothetical protein n=1 Tax=Hyalangium versicolor TaxID=2861190 RepID=UPI001CCFC703|nr:hypothetical protein [Hyalangium versicolor]